jgi:Domain of unknown function (DUF892)
MKVMGFFSRDIKTMDDLFVQTLSGIYYAEQRLVEALSTLIEKATNPQLRSLSNTTLPRLAIRWAGSNACSKCTVPSPRPSTAQPSTGSFKKLTTSQAKSMTTAS